jgi:hypothetical protein
VPFVHDRVGFVKETFAAVEKEAKADLAELQRNMLASARKVDLRMMQQQLKREEFDSMRAEHQQREAGLHVRQQELQQTMQAGQETEQKHDRLRMELVTEAQSWRDVFQQRLSEELKKRQRLAHLQERRTVNAVAAKRELADLAAKVELLDAKAGEYETDEYLSLVKERDAAMDVVRRLTEEFGVAKKQSGHHHPTGSTDAANSGQQAESGIAASPASRSSSSKRSSSSLLYRSGSLNTTTGSSSSSKMLNDHRDVLSTNVQLRSLISRCRHDTEQEEKNHVALADDLNAFQAECLALQEEELLLDVERKREEQCRQQLKAAAAATEALIAKQRDLVDELKSQPRFYIERQRLKAAVERRKGLEREVERAKATRSASVVDLQQQVFSERLRVIGLGQRGL